MKGVGNAAFKSRNRVCVAVVSKTWGSAAESAVAKAQRGSAAGSEAYEAKYTDKRFARRMKMLVLSRKVNEEVQIGDDCTIKVVRLGNGRVRFGICAPEGVAIVRRELLLQTQGQADESDKAA